MQLDKRFKVLPFCCFGTDKKAITNHIGKKGYFANRISSFKDINLCKYGTLGTVLGDQQESFYMNETKETFDFFIPECFVKPKEKKYRPYTLQEFFKKFPIGKPIRLRRKDIELDKLLIFNGYEMLASGNVVVHISDYIFTFNELFNEYEYKNPLCKWVPFGVEE